MIRLQFCRKHREEGALDKFYNANINLATGLQVPLGDFGQSEASESATPPAMNLFRPEPAIVLKTKLPAGNPVTPRLRISMISMISMGVSYNDTQNWMVHFIENLWNMLWFNE